MTSPLPPLGLFQGYGVELEYMIVRQNGLDVFPIADEILSEAAGRRTNEAPMGPLGWSNELSLHVLEMKTNGPVPTLTGLGDIFQRGVQQANDMLLPRSACLLPTAVHPWMDPATEGRLWPHNNAEIYATYDRIFGCSGHGWTNLQSVHLNLPFSGDEEFGRLHAAVRLVLPLLPGLAASSPILDGHVTGLKDSRLSFYGKNQASLPSITGKLIPEPAYTAAEYREQIFDPIEREIRPWDPDGILECEWLNSRGAIARFDRNAIEIRVLDIQECPRADVAVCAAAVAAIRACVEERWLSWAQQKEWDADRLAAIFRAAVRDGEDCIVDDSAYLEAFGLCGKSRTLRDFWAHIVSAAASPEWSQDPTIEESLGVIIDQGTLSSRILRAAGPGPPREILQHVYARLVDCLAHGKAFIP